MRLTRDKIEQLHETMKARPDLEVLDVEEGETDGKIRAFEVRLEEKRKPIKLGTKV